MKFLLKEQFVPASVNKLYFNLAPILAMVPALVTVAVIPFAPGFDLRPIASWLATPLHWGGDRTGISDQWCRRQS